MLDFFQKYLCFGNGKQRSFSAQSFEKRRPIQKHTCNKCEKEFTSRNLYEIHKASYCPGSANNKTVDKTVPKTTSPRSKMQKSTSMSRSQMNGEEKEGKKMHAKSPSPRSQVYRQNDGEKETSTYTVSVSQVGSDMTITSTEKRRNRVQCIPIIQKTVTGDEDGLDDGEPPSDRSEEPACPIERLVKELKGKSARERQPLELKFIEENITKNSQIKYVISDAWISRYTDFLNGSKSTPPGPIDNHDIKQRFLTKRVPETIYSVNQFVWKFMTEMYGGGPEIPQANRTNSNASSNESDKYSEPHTADTLNRSEGTTDSLRTSVVETAKSGVKKTNFYLRPMGMTNESFFCYMNSCLQGLIAIGEFSYYVNNEQYKTAVNTKNYKFWKGMSDVVAAHSRRSGECTPKAIRRISQNIFDPDEQHDAHEFFRFLLSGLQDEINLSRPKKEVEINDANTAWAYYRKYNISIIDELFAGQLLNRVLCTACNHVSTTYDPFLDLSLPIISGKTRTIDDCLDVFQKEEEIRDAYVCEKCKSKSRAIKRLVVSRFPKYLVIHLKRFQTYPRKRKIIDPIGFSLDNWNVKKVYEKEVNSYSLVGSIVHRGTSDSGHYVCYSKRGGEWILCDDENTKIVSSKEVATKEAYVLIYEKKN